MVLLISLAGSSANPPGFSSTRSSPSSEQNNGADTSPKLCLGFADLFIAFFLIVLILATVLGNVLVVLSVFLYKRMRTFTNLLLTSLATADLLVGMLIMPLSLFDLLHNHNWPLGRALCRIWATFDVLLCTASILNLCIISLDRYMAITSPLRYPRTRSRCMACALLCFVWGMSFVVCSPPWFVDEWRISFDSINPVATSPSPTSLSRPFSRKAAPNRNFLPKNNEDDAYQCAYPMSVSYRIYSASVSFYIPLVVMLFVYFKIFRVASERERLIREGMGTCRLSRRVEKTQLKGRKRSATTNYTHRSNAPRIREVVQTASDRAYQSEQSSKQNSCPSANHANNSIQPNRAIPPLPLAMRHSDDRPSSEQLSPTQAPNSARSSLHREGDGLSYDSEETSCPPSARNSARGVEKSDVPNRCADSLRRKIKSMECLGTLQQNNASPQKAPKYRKNSADPVTDKDADVDQDCSEQRRLSSQNLQPPNSRMANGARPLRPFNAKQHTTTTAACKGTTTVSGPVAGQFTSKNANLRGSKEKIVYLRERKALKTIGIVVLGFIICWLPFFVVYVLEVSPLLKRAKIIGKREFQLLSEFFLWLGYSNSVLNPLIYTMYNSDFRRCFRDLLGLGCLNQHRRTMSVKKLHQQSTVF